MGLLDTFNHLLNFCAPAFALAVMMPVFARLAGGRGRVGPVLVVQSAVHFAAALAALLGGLWVFGHDGKMATYTAAVLACATAQWLMQRAWKA